MPRHMWAPAGVVSTTGYAEALAVYKYPAFSPCNSVVGPYAAKG